VNPGRRLLLPMAGCGALIVAWVLLGWLPGDPPSAFRHALAGVAAASVLALLAVAWVSAGAALRGAPASPPATGPAPERRIAELEARLAQRDAELEQALRAARDAESRLKAAEERYALAVRSASDGLWEWNLESGAVYLSPRWKSMLGFAGEELAGTRQAWLGRIHPDDLADAEAALDAHLRGESPRYEHQHRLLHRDGRIRWVLSRGAAVRHASGKAYRVIGLDTDVTRIRQVETVLREIVEGTSGTYGDSLFRSLVQHFALALQVPRAFVTECCDQPATRVRALAHWTEGRFGDTFEYDLRGTPCEGVMEGRTCFYPEGLGGMFPREKAWESYLGVPIFGSDGRVIGHLAFLDRKRMPEEMLEDAIFRVFAARAGAELERVHALAELRRLAAAAVSG
jgi:PAS domain S-box-containing protein